MFAPHYDYTFSYWILAWFFLYQSRTITYSPKLWLGLAIAFNLITLALMIYYSNSLINIGLFVMVNGIIKILPLWLLRKTGYYEADFWFGAGLFAMYCGYLYVDGSSYREYLRDGLQRIKQNLPVGPTEYYIKKLGRAILGKG
jgi:hypothetical protein